jgi:hypothetical protein
MNLKNLLNTKGLSFWLLASAIGLNLIYLVVLLLVLSLGPGGAEAAGSDDLMQVLVLLACLIGPFVIGWVISGMAGDGRGPTYGIYGSFGSAVPLFLLLLYTRSIVILLMVVVVLAGGLNGGTFGEYMRRRNG